jgi:hypothetical protein
VRNIFLDRAACRVLIGCLVLVTLCGCSSWRAKPYPDYLQDSEGEVIERVRVTLQNNDEVIMWNAHVEGDSLVGVVKQEPEGLAASSRVLIPNEAQGPRIAVALADIEKLEVENRTAVTVDMVVYIALLAAFIAVVVAQSMSNWNK